MGNNIFEKLTEKYPFITLCMYANAEYVGVVQNRDDIVTTIYDFGVIHIFYPVNKGRSPYFYAAP